MSEESNTGSNSNATPDPYKVSAAQTLANIGTAQYQNSLNHVNTSNPSGGTSWSQTGTDPTTGAPIYTQSTNLNDQLSNVNTQNQSNQGAYSNMAGANTANANILNGYQVQKLNDAASGYQNSSQYQVGVNNAYTNAAYQQQMALLQPQQQQDTESLQAQLANQGITPGSQAYNNAVNNLSRQQQFANTQAANNAVMSGNQLGLQATTANAGINSQNLSNQQSIASGYGNAANSMYNQSLGYNQAAQVNYPTSNASGNTQVGNTNVSGNAYNSANLYAGQNAANQASTNNLYSGLFGLGAAYLAS